MRDLSRSPIVGALAVLGVLAAATGAGARPDATGTITGSVAPTLRPSAGSVTVVRVIDAASATTAAAGRIGANGRFRFSTPPGVYLVVVEKVSFRSPPLTGVGRLERVREGRTSVIPSIGPRSAKRTIAGFAGAGADLGSIAERASLAAGKPAVAVRNLRGSGPEAILANGLDDMLYADLSGSSCYDLVEWELRPLLLREIRLSQHRLFDPSTRMTPRFINPTVFVEGSLATTGASMSWSIRLREIASGRIIGSDRGQVRAAGYFAAMLAMAKRLRAQLEKELCGRFTGTFSGRTREGAGGQTLDYSFTGTVTFARSSSGDSRPGYTRYRIERIAYRTTFTIGGMCTGTATESASLGPDDQAANALYVARTATPGKGRQYEINFTVERPAQRTLRATCSGTTVDYPWALVAQVITAPAQFYADASATRLRGTHAVPGTPISYTWNLRGSG
jgi:hypothetical protein